MKYIYKSSGLFLSCLLFLFFALFSFSGVARAVTPTLSLSSNGDGDSVQLNVTGDPNTSVLLYYTKSGIGQQILPIGTTNSNGTLTATVSSSANNVATSSLVHVTLGGINGTQSPAVSWPAISSLISSSNMVSLSQTGLVLSIGQSSTITASNMGSSSLYLSNNSNPAIANFNISGAQITVLANSYGSTVGTICLTNNSSNCSSVYVNVQNSNAQPLTFSQNSISLSSGQTVSIQITGGSGSYSVLNNGTQNQGIVQTSISGNTITLTTTSTTGSSSITVCSTDMNSCGIINVTIGSINSAAVSFSQSSPTVAVGQSINVSIYGPTSSLLYVSSNSNPSIVQANLSGTTLTLLGITNGSSVINICASASNCGSLTVTVNYNSASTGRLTLSQDSITLAPGQTSTVTISGGAMPYNIVANANNVVQTTLNGNIVSLYGVSSGSSLINVCSTAGNCVTLSVTVSGSNYVPPAVVNIPSDCTGTLYSMSTGQACPASTVNTTPPVVVTPTPTPTITPTATVAPSAVFKFTKELKLNSKGTEVSELQKKLKTLGFYKGKVDGGFGATTEKAVKAFQKAHKLSQVGSVGPSTRALLNK